MDRDGIEVALAEPEPSAAADASSASRERFRAVLEGIKRQLQSERYCQITFEVSTPDQEAEEKPTHPLQAMQRLMRFGQGVKAIKESTAIPQDRCAQYRSEDRNFVH